MARAACRSDLGVGWRCYRLAPAAAERAMRSQPGSPGRHVPRAANGYLHRPVLAPTTGAAGAGRRWGTRWLVLQGSLVSLVSGHHPCQKRRNEAAQGVSPHAGHACLLLIVYRNLPCYCSMSVFTLFSIFFYAAEQCIHLPSHFLKKYTHGGLSAP